MGVFLVWYSGDIKNRCLSNISVHLQHSATFCSKSCKYFCTFATLCLKSCSNWIFRMLACLYLSWTYFLIYNDNNIPIIFSYLLRNYIWLHWIILRCYKLMSICFEYRRHFIRSSIMANDNFMITKEGINNDNFIREQYKHGINHWSIIRIIIK